MPGQRQAFLQVFHFLKVKHSLFPIQTEIQWKKLPFIRSTAIAPLSGKEMVHFMKQIIPHPGLRILLMDLKKPVKMPFLLPGPWLSVRSVLQIPILTGKLKMNMLTGLSCAISPPNRLTFQDIFFRIKRTINCFSHCLKKLLPVANISSFTAAKTLRRLRRNPPTFLHRFLLERMQISYG